MDRQHELVCFECLFGNTISNVIRSSILLSLSFGCAHNRTQTLLRHGFFGAFGVARIEASGFHGREPAEFRWDIDQDKSDSWRLTVQPGRNWSGQYSYSHITSPEALFPNEDQARMIASMMYNRPLQNGSWASTSLWGWTSSLSRRSVQNSYLIECTVRFRIRNYGWVRVENADRTDLLTLGENPLPLNFREVTVGRVQGFTFGYDRDFAFVPHLASALGAQFTTYGVADTLKPIYGAYPAGVAVFMRFRPFSGNER